jgi:hypothetical protein
MILEHKLRCATNKSKTGGIVLYSQPGATVNTQTTYSIRVPDGISTVAGLAIAAGGGAGGTSSTASAAAGGGGGGALSYTNNISVTPGETLSVLIPNQSSGGSTSGGAGTSGLAAQILRSATVLLGAAGGSASSGVTGGTATAGGAGGAAASGVGTTKYSGGTGGAGNAPTDQGGGGGGAAGYAGNGGTGGTGGGSGASGSGGGGGGGASYTNSVEGGTGGGTLWYGVGTSGAGGTNSATQTVRNGKMGSSLGGDDSILISPVVGTTTENNMGMPGGGGAGAPSGGSIAVVGMRGAGGAVRILWGNNLDYGNGSSAVASNDIFFKGYTTSSTSTITMPSVELGDTVTIIDFAVNASGAPTAVTPSGFTLRLNTTSGTRRLTTYTRQILSSAETGTVLTGANGTASNTKFAIVISGNYGASYSPRGTDTTGNGAVGAATAYSYNYTESPIDGFAQGSTVGFLFFNSTSVINPGVDMTYPGSMTIPGPDGFTYVMLSAYPQTTTTLYIPVTTANLGTNTYNFWTTKFF